MINRILKPEEINSEKYILIDVRSSSEYEKAKIPGALNLPILEDKEKQKVGQSYWKKGLEDAIKVGENICQPKLKRYVQQVKKMLKNKEGVVYCFRGGLRSKLVVKLLVQMDIPVYQLGGGYKAYRRMVYDYLRDFIFNKNVFVLYGYTGNGKTDLLKYCDQKGLPVIDIESFANHRGSIFGDLGLNGQPSQKDFESLLFNGLKKLESAPFLIIEGESRKIGQCHLPNSVAELIKGAIPVLINSSIKERIKRINDLYSQKYSIIEINKKINSLKPYLGNKKSLKLKEFINSGRTNEFIEMLLLDYYDPLYYRSSIKNRDFRIEIDINLGLGAAYTKMANLIKLYCPQEQIIFNQAC